MGNVRRQFLLNSMKVFDLVLMVASFGLAAVVVSENATVSVAEFLALRVKIQNFVTFSLLLLVWHLIFSSFGMYASRRLSRLRIAVRLRMVVAILATQNTPRNSAVIRVMWNTREAKKTTNVPSVAALMTSTTSSQRPAKRREAYIPNEEKIRCQTRSKSEKVTKF